MGIVAIEKHFKLNFRQKTIDSKFSIDPKQLKQLKNNLDDIYFSLKKNKKRIKTMIYMRRSIFSKKNIKKGEKITVNNIETFRPKIGISAADFFKILGKKSKKNIKAFSPIFKSYLN